MFKKSIIGLMFIICSFVFAAPSFAWNVGNYSTGDEHWLISCYYAAITNRPSDTLGFQYWLAEISEDQRPIAEVATSFINAAGHGENVLNNSAFVERLYHTIAFRSSDLGGLAYWVNQLENSSSPFKRGILLHCFLT